MITFPVMSLFPASLFYNLLAVLLLAPYPLLPAGRIVLLAIGTLVLICVNGRLLPME